MGVESEVGRGTTFKVYLPRIDDQVEAIREPAAIEIKSEGRETILVVEDEDIVRNLAVEVLETLGIIRCLQAIPTKHRLYAGVMKRG